MTTHYLDALALVRETATKDRSLTESQLRDLNVVRTCRFLARHTGLSYEEVIDVYLSTRS